MNRRWFYALVWCGAMLLSPLLSIAQENPSGEANNSLEAPFVSIAEENLALDIMLEEALQSAEDNDWETALRLLDDAEAMAPDDTRIQSYRSSILKLKAVYDAQLSWARGDSVELPVAPTEPVSSTEDEAKSADNEETPKFVLDRGERGLQKSPALYRDNLRADLAVKIFASESGSSQNVNPWSSGDEFFYSSLRFDLRYWIPLMGRILGLNFRSNGYSWLPGDPSIVHNSLDLGFNLRGFLMESQTSRLEIGIDLGGSLQTANDNAIGSQQTLAIFLGLWLLDPLLFHLFRVDSLENLVFGGGLRIYSTLEASILDTIVYRMDGAWNFEGGFAGIRLEWWDFVRANDRTNVLSFSLFGGYRF